jgi:tetratricopeptide (TPR) repeat protein
LQHFAEAKKLATAAKDLRGLAYGLKCHAECLSLLGHRAAIDESLTAVQIFENIGLKIGLAYALKSSGDIYRRNRDYAAALGSYRNAAQVFSKCNDARGLAYAMNGIGSALSEMGSAEDAGICFAHAICYFNSTGLGFGSGQSFARLSRLVQQQQLNSGCVCELLKIGHEGHLPLPGIVTQDSSTLPERRELALAGWRLLNHYRRRGVRYLRAERAKVWEGSEHADCSSFVQHALIEAGYDFARSGRLTTARLQHDAFWSDCFREVPRIESRPGDIILQGGLHMGILTGFTAERPTGFQMGMTSRASELDWREGGHELRFFRLKPRNGS